MTLDDQLQELRQQWQQAQPHDRDRIEQEAAKIKAKIKDRDRENDKHLEGMARIYEGLKRLGQQAREREQARMSEVARKAVLGPKTPGVQYTDEDLDEIFMK